MKRARALAELVASPLLIPFFPKITFIVGLPAFSIAVLGIHVVPGGESVFNIHPERWKAALFLVLFILCALPWVALAAVHAIDSLQRTRMLKDPVALQDLRSRFHSGEKLENAETDVLSQDIASRLRSSHPVSVYEETFYILQNQAYLEQFLYDAPTERFGEVFDYLASTLDDNSFKGLILISRAVIPGRFSRLTSNRVLSRVTVERIRNVLDV